MLDASGLGEFLSIEDLTQLLPVSRDTIYRLTRLQSFPAIRIGKRVIVEKNDFVNWWESNKGKEIVLN